MKNVLLVLIAFGFATQSFADMTMPNTAAAAANGAVNGAATSTNNAMNTANSNAAAAQSDATAKANSTKKSKSEKLMVNLNTASPDQIAKLPGTPAPLRE